MNRLKNKNKRNVLKNNAAQDTTSKNIWSVPNTKIGRTKQETDIADLLVNAKRVTDLKCMLNELAKHFTQNQLSVQK